MKVFIVKKEAVCVPMILVFLGVLQTIRAASFPSETVSPDVINAGVVEDCGGYWTNANNPNAQASVMFVPRKVRDDEIIEKRNDTEDRLRHELLAMFSDEATLKKLRMFLNRSWDGEGLEYVGSLDGGYPQLGAVANLLAYVSSAYGNDDVVSSKARESFDKLLDRTVQSCNKGGKQGEPSAIALALLTYGNPKLLLTPAFWKAMDAGFPFIRAIEKYGDAESLTKLREFRARCNLPPVQLRILDRKILALEKAVKHPE